MEFIQIPGIECYKLWSRIGIVGNVGLGRKGGIRKNYDGLREVDI